ncbi:MAG: methanogen output domain 1-containing protein [Actinomycetota bacterium]|nr:methanogen output domain 1-containing protein [Actinomycetota bacterium]
MDWFLDPADGDAARALRRELIAYLRRHGDGSSDFAAAQLAFAEVVGNVRKHTGGPAWINVDWSGECPVLTVVDLGPGFSAERIGLPADPAQAGGRGLFLVSHLAGELAVMSRRAGGAKVSVTLPVRRASEESFDPPRRVSGSLPAPEEAGADGSFDKESFLRALVVQLAQHLEHEQGPAAAQAAVAQVGADVGGRMEDEYRHARRIVGRLTAAQMADLYLRLKHAIDGDFYLVDADEQRIVLGNRRCPFGSVVRRAPALCRMTSSVFGGIAARNVGESGVHLEERIAVGDPECRVTVWLGAPPDAPGVHRYRRPEAP